MKWSIYLFPAHGCSTLTIIHGLFASMAVTPLGFDQQKLVGKIRVNKQETISLTKHRKLTVDNQQLLYHGKAVEFATSIPTLSHWLQLSCPKFKSIPGQI